MNYEHPHAEASLTESAINNVLGYLGLELPFAAWMVTRNLGSDYVILQIVDSFYDVSAGTVLPWSESLCSRAVNGEGPSIAPDLAKFSAYASAPVCQQFQIGAYAGVPITTAGGSLFGTLCASNPTPLAETVASKQGLLSAMASLISAIIDEQLQNDHLRRQLASISLEPGAKSTGNKSLTYKAWTERLQFEASQSKLLGNPIRVTVIKNIEDARANCPSTNGDCCTFHHKLKSALFPHLHSDDFLAPISQTEVALLTVGHHSLSDHYDSVLSQAMQKAHLKTSAGYAMVHRSGSLPQAEKEAKLLARRNAESLLSTSRIAS